MSELERAVMEELDAETDTDTEMVTVTVTEMVTVAGVETGEETETGAESDTDTETVTEMVTIADVETDAETETDAEMSDVMSDADSDWEGGGGDVADLEDVAEATGQCGELSSDLSKADADFIGALALDMRAPTPRSLTAPAWAGTLSVKVPISKSRLRNFLRCSATLRPGALAGRMKARAQEARRPARRGRGAPWGGRFRCGSV